MAENYKLVSEDEWQAMVDRAEVADGWSEHWKERAELAEKSERQLAAVLDQKADREEPVEWADRGKTETVSRYDTDGRLIYQGPLEYAPAFGESETDTRDNTERMIQEPSREWTFSIPTETQPQRPHESLVWAMFLIGSELVRDARTLSRFPNDASHDADEMLERWRARWPESE